MAIRRTFPAANAEMIYAKIDGTDFTASPWESDVVAFTAISTLDLHDGTLDETKDYLMFLRAGGTPAASDTIIGAIPRDADAAVLAFCERLIRKV